MINDMHRQVKALFKCNELLLSSEILKYKEDVHVYKIDMSTFCIIMQTL